MSVSDSVLKCHSLRQTLKGVHLLTFRLKAQKYSCLQKITYISYFLLHLIYFLLSVFMCVKLSMYSVCILVCRSNRIFILVPLWNRKSRKFFRGFTKISFPMQDEISSGLTARTRFREAEKIKFLFLVVGPLRGGVKAGPLRKQNFL